MNYKQVLALTIANYLRQLPAPELARRIRDRKAKNWAAVNASYDPDSILLYIATTKTFPPKYPQVMRQAYYQALAIVTNQVIRVDVPKTSATKVSRPAPVPPPAPVAEVPPEDEPDPDEALFQQLFEIETNVYGQEGPPRLKAIPTVQEMKQLLEANIDAKELAQDLRNANGSISIVFGDFVKLLRHKHEQYKRNHEGEP